MNLDTRLRSLFVSGHDVQLRSFACECCQRLVAIWDDASLPDLISLARMRIVRNVSPEELDAWRDQFDPIYDSLYPGYGAPSVSALALAAAGEAAFTESALTAATNAAQFAAEAIAKNAAIQGDAADYDRLFNQAYQSERDRQSELLTTITNH